MPSKYNEHGRFSDHLSHIDTLVDTIRLMSPTPSGLAA